MELKLFVGDIFLMQSVFSNGWSLVLTAAVLIGADWSDVGVIAEPIAFCLWKDRERSHNVEVLHVDQLQVGHPN